MERGYAHGPPQRGFPPAGTLGHQEHPGLRDREASVQRHHRRRPHPVLAVGGGAVAGGDQEGQHGEPHDDEAVAEPRPPQPQGRVPAVGHGQACASQVRPPPAGRAGLDDRGRERRVQSLCRYAPGRRGRRGFAERISSDVADHPGDPLLRRCQPPRCGAHAGAGGRRRVTDGSSGLGDLPRATDRPDDLLQRGLHRPADCRPGQRRVVLVERPLHQLLRHRDLPPGVLLGLPGIRLRHGALVEHI
mmetsp:Transcript_107599/g.321770  ORF Transcript_107599/g.321770 Transcript_107599/m.321770 type:complete len:246 (+) Transcript_107599:496-1233(+)